jgi:hypothetical protein
MMYAGWRPFRAHCTKVLTAPWGIPPQVHKTGGKDANYAEFLAELPEAECRYGVFDVEYEDPKTSSKRNKITFFAWWLFFIFRSQPCL